MLRSGEMRVVFLEDVDGVALGGEVKDVKNGFARNYLIPKNLAAPATHNALQRIKGITLQAEKDRTRRLSDMRGVADSLEGLEVAVEMRAGASGQLYGSVTNVVIADKIFEQTGVQIDRRIIGMSDSIRELGRFEVNIRLHSEIQLTVNVLVHPTGMSAEDYAENLASSAEDTPSEEESSNDESHISESSEETVVSGELSEGQASDEISQDNEPVEEEKDRESSE